MTRWWLVMAATLIAAATLPGCGDDGQGAVATGDGGGSDGGGTGDGGGTDDGDDDTTAVTWETFADRPCPEDSVLTWDNFGGPFINSWCVGCHHSQLPEGERADAPLGVDFDTRAGIRQWAPRIWARSADGNATMPPVGGPGAMDRFHLGEWLACGAP